MHAGRVGKSLELFFSMGGNESILNNFFVVADSVVLDPRIAAWLINPSDTVPSFECLMKKYFEKPFPKGAENTDTGTLRNVSVSSLFSIVCGWAKKGRK